VTSSSTAISGSSFSRSRSGPSSHPQGTDDSSLIFSDCVLMFPSLFAALQICSLRLSDLSQSRYSIKSLKAESQSRNQSLVPRASTLITPGSLLKHDLDSHIPKSS